MAKNVLFFSIREKTSIKISLMNKKKTQKRTDPICSDYFVLLSFCEYTVTFLISQQDMPVQR